MAMSAHASLSFGWDLGEDADSFAPEGVIAENNEFWHDDKYSDIIDWLDSQDQNVLQIVHYRHLEYPKYILALKPKSTWVTQGYPEKMQTLPQITPSDIQIMKDQAQKLGIAVLGEPQWILSAYYA